MSEEKKSKKKSIEENVEESVSRKKSKKEKINEDEDNKSIHKKSKKEKKKKDKKEKRNSKDTEEKVSCEKNDSDNKKSDSVDDVNKIEAEIHTANNWEEADLGNDQRKLKFLKLMGAFKHKSDKDMQHKHCRGKIETQKIAEDLEKQFNEGLNHKFKANHHLGLGYNDIEQTNKAPKNKHIVFDN